MPILRIWPLSDVVCCSSHFCADNFRIIIRIGIVVNQFEFVKVNDALYDLRTFKCILARHFIRLIIELKHEAL